MFTNVDRIQKWSPLPFLYSHACMISHSFGSDSCDPVNCSPPGFSIHGIILAEILAAAAKLLQSCPTLCNSVDGSPSGSPVSGILQARILEWVATSFSNAWKWKVKEKSLSRARLRDPMDCSLPGSSIHGIFQARVLEWGAIAFSASNVRYHIWI